MPDYQDKHRLVAELELMIDGSSLGEVLEGLSDVCELKGQHISANWQDHILAACWHRAAEAIAKLATSASVTSTYQRET